MKRHLFLILLATIPMMKTHAQGQGHQDHESHEHGHHKNEIGLANSAIYFVKEKILAYGLHVHYLKSIPASPFALGLGYERIFDEHKHNNIGLVLAYYPLENLNLNVAPGLTFEDENGGARFAMHLEASYGIEIGHIHLGPVMGFAYDPEDYHLSLGLHIGYDF